MTKVVVIKFPGIILYTIFTYVLYNYKILKFVIIYYLRNLLKTNGVLLPEKIFLMGQLVYSEDLPNMVYVQNINLQRSSSFDIDTV